MPLAMNILMICIGLSIGIILRYQMRFGVILSLLAPISMILIVIGQNYLSKGSFRILGAMVLASLVLVLIRIALDYFKDET